MTVNDRSVVKIANTPISIDRLERAYKIDNDCKPESGAKLVCADGTEIAISPAAFTTIQQILPAIESQRSTITISPADSRVTISQAADILNVRRDYLTSLLDRNEIEHVKTETGASIQLQHLLAYRSERDRLRRQSLDALAELMEEEGFFD
jgi:excisionase family DNA binding protein